MTRPCCYGPVSSRRLGRSLGVDILPFKTCSYDCVYCQLGRTTRLTQERREYVSAGQVLAELKDKLALERPDIISFAGSGEPTLNTALGTMLRGIHAMTDVPCAVFTNGSMLWDPAVRADLVAADIVSPSLDASLPATAARVNRPCQGFDFVRMLEGFKTFCQEYEGRIWVEVLLCDGVNDSPEDLRAAAAFLSELKNVERIQLNSVSRPPADEGIRPVPRERLEQIAALFPANTEIVASYPKASATPAGGAPVREADEPTVFSALAGHPCTAGGVAAGLGCPEQSVQRVLDGLLASGRITAQDRAEGRFYSVVR